MNNEAGSRMTRYGIAAACVLVYAGVSAWLVANEGESYRNQTSRRAIATKQDPSPPETTERPARTKVAKKPKPAIIPSPEPETETESPPRPIPPPAKPEPKAVVVVAEPKPDSSPAPVSPAKIDPFWEEPAQKKVWDLEHLKAEDERRLGGSLHEMVRHFHPRLEVGPLPKRMMDVGELYQNTCSRKDVEYTFTVCDCPQLNAFSHPGGYIYVCRGLFNQIGEDEDHALEFILLHEMAHVDLAHAIVCLKDPEVKKMFDIGTVPLFYSVPIPGGYLENQEYEADRWAAERMIKMGRSRYQILAFLRILEVYARLNGFENYRKNPGDPPLVPLFDNHIRAHPVPSKRLKKLTAFIDGLQKT